MNQNRELTGRVLSVRFRDPESRFTVAEIRSPSGDTHTIVGTIPELHEGEELTLEGSWKSDPDYGRQFEVDSIRTEVPTDSEGLKRYLASDQIRGIGESRAEDIVETFGDRTIEILNNEIERLTEIEGIGDSTLESIREDWNRQQELRDLHLFLQTQNLPSHLAEKLHDEYGQNALRILKEQPYQLCRSVEGIGFKTADKIARSVSLDRTSSSRYEAGFRHVLEQAADEGHTYLPRSELLETTAEILNVENNHNLDESLARMVANDNLIEEPLDDDTIAVLLPGFRTMQSEIASSIAELLNNPPEISEPDDSGVDGSIQFTPEQQRAISMSFNQGIMLLTGGPGTGKTTVINGLVELHLQADRTVKLAAPTGRAAQRLEETTDHNAQTIHRLLGFQPPNTFKHGPEEPLAVDILILDEVSMVDLWLFHRLIRALPADTTLVLVGDPDQLPSVGPGNVLQDIQQANRVPSVQLETIFRQARESDIVANAHRINSGEFPNLTNRSEGDCFFIEVEEPRQAVQQVESLASNRLPDHYDLNPLEDLQVLAPMYGGTGGVNQLNEILQDRLNPGPQSEEPFASRGFRTRDRVMQLRNNYDRGIFNGDIGKITELDHSGPTISVQFPRTGTVELEPAEWDDLKLAYAATIHKSQGSEYSTVIIVLLTNHYILLQRNLLYTALTRAEDLAVIVGQKQALGIAVNNDDVTERNTLLGKKLQKKLDQTRAFSG